MKAIKFRFDKNEGDPEKAVLPALIFISAQHPKYRKYNRTGFALALGWWHWSVALHIHWADKASI